jgi:hypothetical protein
MNEVDENTIKQIDNLVTDIMHVYDDCLVINCESVREKVKSRANFCGTFVSVKNRAFLNTCYTRISKQYKEKQSANDKFIFDGSAQASRLFKIDYRKLNVIKNSTDLFIVMTLIFSFRALSTTASRKKKGSEEQPSLN